MYNYLKPNYSMYRDCLNKNQAKFYKIIFGDRISPNAINMLSIRKSSRKFKEVVVNRD